MLPGVAVPSLLGHKDSNLLTTTFRPGRNDADSGLQDTWPPVSAQGQQVAVALHSVAVGPWPLRISSKGLVVGVDEKPQFLPKQPGDYE